MTTITTATGKVFNSGYFTKTEDPDCLYFDINGEDPKTVNDVFADPEETTTLEYNEQTYEGYTKFGNIQVFYDAVRVRLDKWKTVSKN